MGFVTEFPCRTTVLSGTTIRVSFYSQDGQLVTKLVCNSIEYARWFIQTMSSQKLHVQMEEQEWSKEVCIECGDEKK